MRKALLLALAMLLSGCYVAPYGRPYHGSGYYPYGHSYGSYHGDYHGNGDDDYYYRKRGHDWEDDD